MKSRILTLGAWAGLIAAILSWVVFGYFVRELSALRAVHAAEELDSAQNEERARAAARLHALVRDSQTEREILEELARIDVIHAAEAIEAAGKAAGASVSVRGATASSLSGQGKSLAVKDLRAVEITVDAEGKFLSLIKAISLFEALPFLSSVERLEFEEKPASPGAKKAADAWRMAARIRIITTSPVGI